MVGAVYVKNKIGHYSLYFNWVFMRVLFRTDGVS